MASRKEALRWIPLSGKPEITPKSISYHPEKIEEGPNAGQYQIVVLRSNRYFQGGEICFEVERKSAESICQIILNNGTAREVWIGFSGMPTEYVIQAFQKGNWETVAVSGWGSNPRLSEWISVRVRVIGSLLELYIDGVKVLAASQVIEKSQVGLCLSGPAEVRVRSFEIAEKKPEVFVVMEFTDEFNDLYREVIVPACGDFGYACVRADDIYTNRLIIEDITTSIKEAAVVIADVTPNNPNVYYEVGYSHGLGKPTILLADKTRDQLPFDISGFRTVFYDNTIGGKSQIEERLRKHLAALTR